MGDMFRYERDGVQVVVCAGTCTICTTKDIGVWKTDVIDVTIASMIQRMLPVALG